MVDVKVHEHLGYVKAKRAQEIVELRKMSDITIFTPENDIAYMAGYLQSMVDFNIIPKNEYDILKKYYVG